MKWLNGMIRRETVACPRVSQFGMATAVWAVVTCLAAAPGALGADAAGPETIGMVVAVRGDVQAIDAKRETRKLELKGPILLGDTVKTGPRGRVQLNFRDNTTVNLGRDTEVVFENYQFNETKKEGAMVTEVKEGAFRIMGGAITKISPDNFQTKTPTATIGIRGSFFAGRLTGSVLSVVFLGGKGITVQNPAGTVEIQTPSFGTVVRSGDTPPDEPREFSAKDINALGTGAGANDGDAPGGTRQGAGLSGERLSLASILDAVHREADRFRPVVSAQQAAPNEATPPGDPPPPGQGDYDDVMILAKATETEINWVYWLNSMVPNQNLPDPTELALDPDVAAQGYVVAGVRTWEVNPAALGGGSSLQGRYVGDAHCTEIIPGELGPTVIQRPGQSDINVNFGSRLVDGLLSFVGAESVPSVSMQMSGNFTDAANGIVGRIDSVTVGAGSAETPSTSAIQADFFGKTAEALGGAFKAQMTDERQYLGAFGGVKQPGD
ncbi:MAG: hypothetical protein A3K19_15070 [Lentisphaerae bacterium RIFOXYB12_FULL_65_16]|nr:MAG: hypothetical protein A3K18_01650 [Lentisphaerae bacterium RIFOXYA12_64_32]OGV85955.1 MAG: hypothetical protein A3K19_15070 [Lentisphaerae bacterium RIFOXYB12_FULL_65_16]